MSKVIINKKYLQTRVKRDLFIAIGMFLAGLFGMAILADFGRTASVTILLPFTFLLLPSLLFFVAFKKEKAKVTKDNAALKDLENLPEEYTVLRNVYVPYRGEVIECDFLVIGRNGVFIIEVNGSKGYIQESKDFNFWLRYKGRKKSKMFVKALPNQTRVLETKVLALLEYLQRFKVPTWIQGVVYFSDKKAKVDLINHKSVFHDSDELLGYITQFPTKVEIDEMTREKIENLLRLDTIAN